MLRASSRRPPSGCRPCSNIRAKAIRIFEVDRLSPLVVDNVSDLHALGAQLIALFGQNSRRTGLESKMIEAGGNTEPAIDARVVFCRHGLGTSFFFPKRMALGQSHHQHTQRGST